MTTEALVLAYMWSQLGTDPKNGCACVAEGDGVAAAGRRRSPGPKSSGSLCGLAAGLFSHFTSRE